MRYAITHHRSRAVTIMAGLAMSLFGLTMTQAAPRRVVLPPGTVIPVRLDQALSSKTAHNGERFTATVRYGNDDAGLPEGTRVEGVVREVMRHEGDKPGVLDVDFRRLLMPNGTAVALDGSLISLDAKSIKRTESGRLVASTDKGKDRLKFVGIGAGAGLLISTLTKTNTLTSILLGAGAGYLYNELKKDKPGDVQMKPGTEFGIRLERQLAFNTNRPLTYAAGRAQEDVENRQDSRYYRRDATGSRAEDDRTAPGDADSDIGMLIDDRNVTFGSVKPFMRGDVVYMPLETVARAASFDFTYDTQRRMIYARNRGLRLGLNSRIAVLNGERIRMPGTPEMRGGKLYVPMQFVGLATGGSVSWDADSQTVVLNRDRDR